MLQQREHRDVLARVRRRARCGAAARIVGSRRRGRAWLLIGTCVALGAIATGSVPVAAQGRASRGSGALSAVRSVDGWVSAGLAVGKLSSGEASQLRSNLYAWIPASACLAAAIRSNNATPCVLGDTASTSTVVLVGDSTADQWAPDLAALGAAHRFRVVVYVRAACPVGNLIVRLGTQSVDPNCAAFRSLVEHDVAAMRPAPSAILVAELRLPQYATPAGGRISNAQWASSLTATLSTLEKSGSELILLHGVPTARYDPAECLSTHTRRVQFCTTPRTVAYLNGYDASAVRGALAARAATADLTPLFCTVASCPDIADGIVVQSGDSHVSQRWATAVEAAFGELVGCTVVQSPVNAAAAAPLNRALDGASPPASLLSACRGLEP